MRGSVIRGSDKSSMASKSGKTTAHYFTINSKAKMVIPIYNTQILCYNYRSRLLYSWN